MVSRCVQVLAGVLVVGLSPFVAAPALAADCIDYLAYMHWVTALDVDGPTNGMALAGDRVYLATNNPNALVIVDVADPTAPVYLGEVALPGAGQDVCVAGDLAFVAAGGAGLQVVDVADPTQPAIIGAAATSDYIFEVAVTGDVVVVRSYWSGIMDVIDVHDPSAPVLVGNIDASTWLQGLEAAGGFAYLLEEDPWVDPVLHVVDLADPARPAVVADVYLTGDGRGLDVQGGIACVATTAGLYVIDVSDPRHPSVVSLSDNHGVDVAIDGPLAYLTNYLPGGGVQVVDLTDPAAPVTRGEVKMDDQSWALVGAGPYLLTGNVYSGLNVVDVHTPDSPPFYGELSPPTYGMSLAMRDRWIYAGGYQRVQVIDAADPQAPFIAGEVLTLGDVRTVVAAGDLAYVIDDSTGLHVIDVHVPSAPFKAGHWATDGEPLDLALAGGYLLATQIDTTGACSLKVLDLTDPSAPATVGSVDLPTGADQVAVIGDHAFVACWQMLVSVDWSDRAHPVVVGQIAMPARRVLAGDGVVYVGANGLQIVDVNAPAQPVILASMPMPGSPYGMALQDGFLYSAVFYGGYLVHDVSDPAHPRLVGGGPASVMNSDLVAGPGLVVISPGVGLGSHPSLQFCYPQCDDGTPVMLADFTARPQGDAVRLDWHLNLSGPDMSFHLTAAQAGRSWTVPVQSAGPGAYFALDADRRRDLSVATTYDLEGRLPGIDWFALASTTVPAIAPGAATALTGVQPNPFNPRATISYTLGRAQRVTVAAYDLAGHRLAVLVDGLLPAGDHATEWDGRAGDGRTLPSGVYLVRMAAEERTESMQVSLVR